MTVIVLENAPLAVRGELTRWFLEVKAGVFVGKTNRRIRDLLWERLCTTEEVRGAVMIYATNNEQGFAMRMHGTPHRRVIEYEGVQLICRDPTALELNESGEMESYDVGRAQDFWGDIGSSADNEKR